MVETSVLTQASMVVSTDPVSSKLMQSVGFLFSSFSKQPLAGSVPPSNLRMTLVTQSLALGSGTLPGVSASCSHLINPVPFFDEHLVLPARHFACWADAGASPMNSNATANAVTNARIVICPLRRAAIADAREDRAEVSI